jgi:GDP/UDP-N,N'-diacetylbacillosamine 2-epimerase (hydrolysing)
MRKVCYVSGTRADFGLMQLTLQKLQCHALVDLSICVTGMHLNQDFGNTVSEIEADGLRICSKIKVELDGESGLQMAVAIGQEMIGIARAFYEERPDIVLVLGDRGEMLAAATAAVHMNIPVVHIHGGELSGTVDESLRHAISKLSHYHFVTTEGACQRLIKMGELADHIFVVGAPGLDSIVGESLESVDTLLPRYGLMPTDNYYLAVFHPVVQQADKAGEQMLCLLRAIEKAGQKTLLLLPNADAGGQAIRNIIKQHDSEKIIPFAHFPRIDYLSLVSCADVLIGNSSSGIIEAASLGTSVVNIGDRQRCRERNANVIDVDVNEENITQAIQKAQQWKGQEWHNVYLAGNASDSILDLLLGLSLNASLLEKLNTY